MKKLALSVSAITLAVATAGVTAQWWGPAYAPYGAHGPYAAPVHAAPMNPEQFEAMAAQQRDFAERQGEAIQAMMERQREWMERFAPVPTHGPMGNLPRPEMPAFERPEPPKFGERPAIPELPAMPERPAMPDLPELPAFGERPSMPGLPAGVSMPQLPEMPTAPDIPGLELPELPLTPAGYGADRETRQAELAAYREQMQQRAAARRAATRAMAEHRRAALRGYPMPGLYGPAPMPQAAPAESGQAPAEAGQTSAEQPMSGATAQAPAGS